MPGELLAGGPLSRCAPTTTPPMNASPATNNQGLLGDGIAELAYRTATAMHLSPTRTALPGQAINGRRASTAELATEFGVAADCALAPTTARGVVGGAAKGDVECHGGETRV